jgi:hypothetical protein
MRNWPIVTTLNSGNDASYMGPLGELPCSPRGTRITHLLRVSADYMDIRCERAEFLVLLFSDHITRAEDMLDPVRHEHLLKLVRDLSRAVGDVAVAHDQHELQN